MMRYWPVYGGGETITVTLSNELLKRGHKVFVSYLFYRTMEPMPYNVNESILGLSLNNYDINNKENINKLHSFLDKNHIDIVINQWGDALFCRKAIEGLNTKLITCWHQEVLPKFVDNEGILKNILKKYFHPLYTWHDRTWKMGIHKYNIDASDRYIFLAKAFYNDYIRISSGYETQKLGYVTNPLTYNTYYDIVNYPQKKKNLLFVGRMLEMHKRMSYILKIWSKVMADSNYEDWNLIMVGDGKDLEKTKSLAKDMGLRNISFEGFKAPKPYYKDASIFLMTSASEGFGMTLLEAQQNAVVPMAMDTYASLHEIIKDGYNGCIIPENDFDTYVDRLKELMTDAEKRKVMAINGLNSSKQFSVKATVDRWESIFKELTDKGNGL